MQRLLCLLTPVRWLLTLLALSDNIPRFIDIDLHDYNMNLDLAEEAINENTRAIIATHTFGYPQDLERLESMVEKAEKNTVIKSGSSKIAVTHLVQNGKGE